ncbi:hypothetical protein D3C72_589640 [compost metagenome]
MIAVRRQAHVTEGEERGSIAVVVMPRLIHHRDIDAGLLQRFDIAQRQQQFFAGIARRIEIEAPGIDQLGHLKQIIRFPVAQGVTVLPLAHK